jgi:hypothetical protein
MTRQSKSVRDLVREGASSANGRGVPHGPRPEDRGGSGQAEEKNPAGLATTCLANIRPVPVRWLVPGYLPLGKLVLVAGDGGHGKSSFTLDLAASLSTGRSCFGLDYDPLLPSDILLVACEDDFADTVVPRLLSARADLGHVFRVDGIKTEGGKTEPFNLVYFQSMEAELRAHPNIRLVVIDPAGAYIGRSGVDDYNDSQLRSLLGPMAELAARTQVTILLVKHLVKGATAKAVHKVSGSAGYVNAVRAAFVVAPDGEDTDKKLFLPLKFNLGPRPSGLAYRMRSLDTLEQATILDEYGQHLDQPDRDRLAQQLFRIAWEGTVNTTADAVMADPARQERGPGKVDQAAEWLEQFLGRYAYPHAEIIAAGEAAGHTRDNLFRARRDKLNEKIKASNRGQFGGQWYWGPGNPDSWVIRPTADNAENADNGANPVKNGLTSPIVSNVCNVSNDDSEVV